MLGVAKLSTSRRGSRIRGSELEPLKPLKRQALARVEHVIGDSELVSMSEMDQV